WSAGTSIKASNLGQRQGKVNQGFRIYLLKIMPILFGDTADGRDFNTAVEYLARLALQYNLAFRQRFYLAAFRVRVGGVAQRHHHFAVDDMQALVLINYQV